VAAVGAAVAGFCLATAVASAVGYLVNAVVGLFVLGAGLYVPAMRFGTIEDLAFAGGSLPLLAAETLLWTALVAAGTLAVFRVAGELPDMAADPGREQGALARLGLRGLVAGLLTLPVVWLLARSALPGQTLAAAVIAGIAVGMAGRALAPGAQPRLLYVAPGVLGAAGYLVASAMVEGSLADAWVADAIPALARPRPVDYAAGSLMGVSMGLGWARSFVPERRSDASAASAGSAPGAGTPPRRGRGVAGPSGPS
jgi:hypothetical protein